MQREEADGHTDRPFSLQMYYLHTILHLHCKVEVEGFITDPSTSICEPGLIQYAKRVGVAKAITLDQIPLQ